jgi:hypothetical protein
VQQSRVAQCQRSSVAVHRVQGILGVGVGKGSEVGAALSKAHEKARPPRAPRAARPRFPRAAQAGLLWGLGLG